ncbi:MAG: 2-C-methyl-D-erythritol 4-phosphate cytidylyltransferase [Planctomycetota bacterium]
MDCGVVVVAAGTGKRLGRSENKAMVQLGDRPLLFHCLERFAAVKEVKEIVLVVHADDRAELSEGRNQELLHEFGVERMVEGGARRQDSVLNGLYALSSKLSEGAMIHDAARPFVSPGLVSVLAKSLSKNAGIVPAIRAMSTVKRVGQDEFVSRTENRKDFWLAQTPQVARRDILIDCLERVDRESLAVTDDAQALESCGFRVKVIEDSRWNFKITTPEDLALAELVLKQRPWEIKR